MASDSFGACPCAVVCRIPLGVRASAPPTLQSSRDLLVAVEDQKLHVFSRRFERQNSTCGCNSHDANNASLDQLGFICPHVAGYDDVRHVLTIPRTHLQHVWVTYRTASAAGCKGVATRTKDLVLCARSTEPSSQILLWLEFEHNLSRGWFLEALSAAPHVEIDHLDLSDVAAVNAVLKGAMPCSVALTIEASPPTLLLRDAWRHVVYDKVKLALQVAHDTPSSCEEDPAVACLLTTAMELSTCLDEPDLSAFTWLTSGFLNAKRAEKQELALNQVLHAVDLARENSFDYLLCLGLQCAASLYHSRPESLQQAREMLTEAARLLARSDRCAAMEPSLKMQLHAKLHEVTKGDGTITSRPTIQRSHSVLESPSLLLKKREELAGGVRSGSSSRLLDKITNKATVFSLWSHLFGTGLSKENSSDAVKRLLLVRVRKPAGLVRGASCCVELLGAHGARKATLKVYYDESSTAGWLREHVTRRYQLYEGGIDPASTIEIIYDPQRKQLLPEKAVLSEWIFPMEDESYKLHAKLSISVVSSHRSSIPVMSQMPKPVTEAASVLCSLCGLRVPLEEAEGHSETCF